MLYENVFFRIIESYIRIMNQNKTMKDMIADERPYEKCERFGAGSLTDIELLAVLLRTGTKGENSLELARKLLYPDTGVQNKDETHLQNWTKEELMKVQNGAAFCRERTGFFQTGYHSGLLYGRYASPQAGAYEAAYAEYPI